MRLIATVVCTKDPLNALFGAWKATLKAAITNASTVYLRSISITTDAAPPPPGLAALHFTHLDFVDAANERLILLKPVGGGTTVEEFNPLMPITDLQGLSSIWNFDIKLETLTGQPILADFLILRFEIDYGDVRPSSYAAQTPLAVGTIYDSSSSLGPKYQPPLF